MKQLDKMSILYEACVKNLEKINYSIINMIESVIYNLTGFYKNEMIVLFLQQFFNKYIN